MLISIIMTTDPGQSTCSTQIMHVWFYPSSGTEFDTTCTPVLLGLAPCIR